jgi:CHAT domain
VPGDGEVLATVRIEEGPLRVHFEFAHAESEVFKIDRASMLEEAWQRASRALTALVDAAKGSADSAGVLAEPLRELKSAGTELGQRLCNNDSGAFNRVQQKFTASRLLGWPRFDRDRIPIVQLTAREASYPLELLPVFLDGRDPSQGIRNDAELLQVAARFLGFTAAVRRMASDSGLRPVRLDNEPTLPIQFIRYQPDRPRRRGAQPSGFAVEESTLTSLKLLSVDGPWPTDQSPADVKTRLAAALFDPRHHLLTDRDDARPAAIAHLACHCNTAGLDSENYELVLRNARGERCPLTFGEIRQLYSEEGERSMGDPLAEPAPPPQRAPIIINACGSSTVDPSSAQSFQQWFLANEHPTYVGTQAAIPDSLAARFSEFLYRFLLGGYTLGEAVVLARRELLTAAHSPLGLLYVLHGNDQVAVDVKHAEELPPVFAV